jgi:hypothetical protein
MLGVTTSCAALLTVIVTGTVTGLFGAARPVAAFVALIVIAPAHVVPAAYPAVAALTETELAVTPETPLVDPFTSNQVPPQLEAVGVTV